jgi:hypothetical protein
MEQHSGMDEHRVVPQNRENEDKQGDRRKHTEREGRLRKIFI